MTLYKNVNGKRIEMSAAEEQALRDKWAAARVFTSADVVRERSKRLAEGFDYDFEGSRGVHHIGTTEEDMRGWDEVTMGANAAVAIGAGSTAFDIITETGPVEVTALEWQSILMAATAFRQPIWTASFTLQQMDPIPDPATWTGWP